MQKRKRTVRLSQYGTGFWQDFGRGFVNGFTTVAPFVIKAAMKGLGEKTRGKKNIVKL
jgi:hypothetical protein